MSISFKTTPDKNDTCVIIKNKDTMEKRFYRKEVEVGGNSSFQSRCACHPFTLSVEVSESNKRMECRKSEAGRIIRWIEQSREAREMGKVRFKRGLIEWEGMLNIKNHLYLFILIH